MANYFNSDKRYRLLLKAATNKGPKGKAALEKFKTLVDFTDIDYPSQRMLPAVTHHFGDDLVSQQMSRAIRFTWLRSQILLGVGLEASRILTAAGIPNLFVKGTAILAITGINAGNRHMDDVDIVVPVEYIKQAVEVMLENSFESLVAKDLLANPDLITRDLHATPFRYVNAAEVDLHWRINKDPRLLVGEQAAWERSQDAELRGQTIKVISPEDLFIQIMLTNRENNDAAWAIDALRLINNRDLDWQYIYEQSKRLDVEGLLLEGLSILQMLTKIKLPVWLRIRTIPTLIRRKSIDVLRRILQAGNIYYFALGVFEATRVRLPRFKNKAYYKWQTEMQAIRENHSQIPKYVLGEEISFLIDAKTKTKNPVASAGWIISEGDSENDGTWTSGEFSIAEIPLANPTPEELLLQIRFIPFTPVRYLSQKVTLYIDGKKVFSKIYSGRKHGIATEVIPVAAVQGRNRVTLGIRVNRPHPTYRFGINVLSIKVTPKAN